MKCQDQYHEDYFGDEDENTADTTRYGVPVCWGCYEAAAEDEDERAANYLDERGG